MLELAFLMALAVSGQDAPAWKPGSVLVVKGTFEPKRLADAGVRKEFVLTAVLDQIDANAVALAWTVEERGAGGWSWVDHFGRCHISSNGKIEGTLPTMNYEREDGNHEVAIALPVARFDEPLAESRTWSEGKLQSEVEGAEAIGGQDAWKVVVRSPIGVRRQYWVDKQSPRIVQLEDTIFIGQGEEHRLRYRTQIVEAVDSTRQAESIGGLEKLEKLRDRLQAEPRRFPREWNDDQLKVLRESLPEFTAYQENEFLKNLVSNLERDAKQQKDRAGAVTALRDRILGKASPAFKLSDSAGEEVASTRFEGNVVVLHFWEYRDNPLQEPYGQSAYLDFLARNHAGVKLKVYGVAVDPRLSDENNRGKAIQSVRKFKEFMNISYPVLLDDGDLIKRYGDPRSTGTRLPLFVVISPQGKVAHYHVGNYDIVPNRGLEELEKVINEAAGK